MSRVTNIVLSFGASETNIGDDKDVIERVNKFFIDDKQRFVVPVNDDWYGGSKFLERPTYVGAFNCLDLNGLIMHLSHMTWQWPKNVQLFVCEQEDNEYRLIYPCGG